MGMTERGEQWAKEKALYDPQYGLVHDFDTIVEFWIRAFCDEVEQRTDLMKPYPHARSAFVGQAFYELKRELLGSH